ncbi:MAG TPA: AAA family ATPase [Candidatus Ozemobacteraceae bacterium]|nr:AAA family ATPase [Candidatus Ozemobacteraceae bacterium]
MTDQAPSVPATPVQPPSGSEAPKPPAATQPANLMAGSPAWAREMAEIFKSGSVSQFILYGNINDWVPWRPTPDAPLQTLSLRDFLSRVMFAPFEAVIAYDRGKGIRLLKGGDLFQSFLKVFDDFHRTSYTSPAAPASDPGKLLELGNVLPKEPKRALELIDRFIRNGLFRTRPGADGKPVPDPVRVAVIIDYAHFLLPRTDPAYTNPDTVETLIRLLDWAADPTINSAFVATCLIAENLTDMNRQVVENPRSAKLRIELPNAAEVLEFIEYVTADLADFGAICDVDRRSLASKLEGLSRLDLQNLIRRAIKNDRRITMEYLRSVKKEMIEKSASGKIEFVESTRTLDDVAGHTEAVRWMRQDAQLMKRGKLKALPMGYLINGRIGTGKTYLVECFAGEAGVPCVELKNFRDKWVGATEGNLEQVFKILHAMGQVIVFVDEADQMAGKRGGGADDGGLSGRIYGMLAREMADTRNRGRIFWIFATSRPDLLEVDLKRVGRLDVHIPLFAPQTPNDKRALFLSLAKKNKVALSPEDIPEFPEAMDIGGNEMEGVLISASRLYEIQEDGTEKRSIGHFVREAFASYRPMAHAERLEYMDLIAVLECTDVKFLPAKFEQMELAAIKRRVDELKHRIGAD